MKCLVTADLHYSLKQWDWLASVAHQHDLVVIAGDLLDLASVLEPDVQAVVILKYLARIRHQTHLLVSSGNHDADEPNAAQERIAAWLQDARPLGIHIDGDAFETTPWLFTICPWSDGPSAKAAVANQLERDARRPKQHWAWIYHAPPDQTRVSWTGKGHFGDPSLTEWIHTYQPDLVLGGHVHQSPFRTNGSWVDRLGKTWVFNAGRQLGPEPAHLVLDLHAMTAQWRSQAGQETLSLLPP